MIWGLLAIAAVFLLIALSVPFAIRSSVAQPWNPKIEPLPEPQTAFGEKGSLLAREILEIGFQPAGAWSVETNCGAQSATRQQVLIGAHLSENRRTDADVILSRTLAEGSGPGVAVTSLYCRFISWDISGKACVTYNYGKDDSFENPETHSYRRLAWITSPRELHDAHLEHARSAIGETVELSPKELMERYVRLHQEGLVSLETRGLLRRDGEIFRATLRLGFYTIAKVISPVGFENRPGKALLVFAGIAALGWAGAWGITALPEVYAPWAASALFLALTTACMLVFPNTRLVAWVWACAPAALFLHRAGVTSWIPWAVSFGAVVLMGPVVEAARYRREKALFEAQRTPTPP